MTKLSNLPINNIKNRNLIRSRINLIEALFIMLNQTISPLHRQLSSLKKEEKKSFHTCPRHLFGAEFRKLTPRIKIKLKIIFCRRFLLIFFSRCQESEEKMLK